MSVKVQNPLRQLYFDDSISSAVHVQDGRVLFRAAYKLESLITVALLIADAEWVRYSYVVAYGGALCSTDTDTRIGIGRIRIRGYIKFLQKLKAQKCIEVSDTDTRIRIGYVIRGHVEVSGLYNHGNGS